MTRPRVIVESPFASTSPTGMSDNLDYLRRCLRDSWERGENPFASHLFYPFFLHESDPEERKAGIEAGYALWQGAEKIIFYVDRGMSPGMVLALNRAKQEGFVAETRTIGVS